MTSLIFLLNINVTHAADKEELLEVLRTDDVTNCAENLTRLYDIEESEFSVFLDAHLKNKSATSTLAKTAIKRYGDHKKRIKSYFGQLNFNTLDGREDSLTAYSRCSELTNAQLSLSKTKLKNSLRNNVIAKKNTALSEKYNQINNQLRNMHLDVAKMYSYFITFNNKLPGFIRSCVTN